MKKYKLSLSKRNILIVCFSFIFAVFLSLIPWDFFRAAEYVDRSNYVNYIDLYPNKIQWFDFSGFLLKILYEWGWHYFLNFMNINLGLNSGAILFLVSMFFLTVSFVLIAVQKRFYTLLFLLNPLFIDFFYSQIRLSFAITFIYLSIIAFNKNKLVSFVLLIPAFFIHTSSFLFAFMFYSAIFLAKTTKIGNRLKFFMSILVGAVVAFVTGPYMSVLLGSVNDRRAEYNDMSSPLLYMVYWIILFLFFMVKYLSGKTQSFNKYYVYITMSILTMVFLNIFMKGYSSRFLAASFPFLILSISGLRGKNDSMVLILYILYTITTWFFWTT